MHQELKTKLAELNSQLNDPAIIADNQKFRRLSKEQAELASLVSLVTRLESIEQHLAEAGQLLTESTDSEIRQMAELEQAQLTAEQAALSQQLDEALHPADPRDKKDVIMEIRAGAGGDEAALFVAEIFRMYSRFAENHGFKLEILNSNPIGIGGYKEITCAISGQQVFGWLKYESGTHRVQRVPETEKQGRVHTSTITVAVLPKLKRLILKLNPAICVLTPIVLLVQAVNALTPPIQLSALSMNRPDWLSPAKIKNPNIKIKKKPCKYCARVFYRKKKTNSAKRPITSAANKSAAAIAVKKSALIIFLKIVLPTIVFKNLGTQLTE